MVKTLYFQLTKAPSKNWINFPVKQCGKFPIYRIMKLKNDLKLLLLLLLSNM